MHPGFVTRGLSASSRAVSRVVPRVQPSKSAHRSFVVPSHRRRFAPPAASDDGDSRAPWGTVGLGKETKLLSLLALSAIEFAATGGLLWAPLFFSVLAILGTPSWQEEESKNARAVQLAVEQARREMVNRMPSTLPESVGWLNQFTSAIWSPFVLPMVMQENLGAWQEKVSSFAPDGWTIEVSGISLGTNAPQLSNFQAFNDTTTGCLMHLTCDLAFLSPTMRVAIRGSGPVGQFTATVSNLSVCGSMKILPLLEHNMVLWSFQSQPDITFDLQISGPVIGDANIPRFGFMRSAINASVKESFVEPRRGGASLDYEHQLQQAIDTTITIFVESVDGMHPPLSTASVYDEAAFEDSLSSSPSPTGSSPGPPPSPPVPQTKRDKNGAATPEEREAASGPSAKPGLGPGLGSADQRSNQVGGGSGSGTVDASMLKPPLSPLPPNIGKERITQLLPKGWTPPPERIQSSPPPTQSDSTRAVSSSASSSSSKGSTTSKKKFRSSTKSDRSQSLRSVTVTATNLDSQIMRGGKQTAALTPSGSADVNEVIKLVLGNKDGILKVEVHDASTSVQDGAGQVIGKALLDIAAAKVHDASTSQQGGAGRVIGKALLHIAAAKDGSTLMWALGTLADPGGSASPSNTPQAPWSPVAIRWSAPMGPWRVTLPLEGAQHAGATITLRIAADPWLDKQSPPAGAFTSGGRRTVVLQIMEGKQLAANDWSGSNDPYVKLMYNDQLYRTRTLYSSNMPVWNQTFTFPENNSLLKRRARLEVWDSGVSRDGMLGKTFLNLDMGLESTIHDRWLQLSGGTPGELRVRLAVVPGAVDSSPVKQMVELMKKVYNSASKPTLQVVVIAARNLRGRDAVSGTAAPSSYCNVTFSRSRQVTQVINQSKNPSWNFSALFPLFPDSSEIGQEKQFSATGSFEDETVDRYGNSDARSQQGTDAADEKTNPVTSAAVGPARPSASASTASVSKGLLPLNSPTVQGVLRLSIKSVNPIPPDTDLGRAKLSVLECVRPPGSVWEQWVPLQRKGGGYSGELLVRLTHFAPANATSGGQAIMLPSHEEHMDKQYSQVPQDGVVAVSTEAALVVASSAVDVEEKRAQWLAEMLEPLQAVVNVEVLRAGTIGNELRNQFGQEWVPKVRDWWGNLGRSLEDAPGRMSMSLPFLSLKREELPPTPPSDSSVDPALKPSFGSTMSADFAAGAQTLQDTIQAIGDASGTRGWVAGIDFADWGLKIPEGLSPGVQAQLSQAMEQVQRQMKKGSDWIPPLPETLPPEVRIQVQAAMEQNLREMYNRGIVSANDWGARIPDSLPQPFRDELLQVLESMQEQLQNNRAIVASVAGGSDALAPADAVTDGINVDSGSTDNRQAPSELTTTAAEISDGDVPLAPEPVISGGDVTVGQPAGRMSDAPVSPEGGAGSAISGPDGSSGGSSSNRDSSGPAGSSGGPDGSSNRDSSGPDGSSGGSNSSGSSSNRDSSSSGSSSSSIQGRGVRSSNSNNSSTSGNTSGPGLQSSAVSSSRNEQEAPVDSLSATNVPECIPTWPTADADPSPFAADSSSSSSSAQGGGGSTSTSSGIQDSSSSDSSKNSSDSCGSSGPTTDADAHKASVSGSVGGFIAEHGPNMSPDCGEEGGVRPSK